MFLFYAFLFLFHDIKLYLTFLRPQIIGFFDVVSTFYKVSDFSMFFPCFLGLVPFVLEASFKYLILGHPFLHLGQFKKMDWKFYVHGQSHVHQWTSLRHEQQWGRCFPGWPTMSGTEGVFPEDVRPPLPCLEESCLAPRVLGDGKKCWGLSVLLANSLYSCLYSSLLTWISSLSVSVSLDYNPTSCFFKEGG